MSVKNGAELLDRLIKDIVSESAASYVSILQNSEEAKAEDETMAEPKEVYEDMPMAFSLARFIPLLQERIMVVNPFTRTFLVSWITLLDSIPDLELVAYLPSFLQGLFKFLNDPNPDVHTTTQVALDRFLAEIKKIARIKRGIAESKKSAGDADFKHSGSSIKSARSLNSVTAVGSDPGQARPENNDDNGDAQSDSVDTGSYSGNDEKSGTSEDDWIPGQDVQVDHAKILDIMVNFLGDTLGKYSYIRLTLLMMRTTNAEQLKRYS
jgi:vacuole morphology and inheritance protein 14